MWLISIVALYITGVLCIVGVLSNTYDDNLGQRIAMAIIAIGCFSRADVIGDVQVVVGDSWMVHCGMAVFAASTAFRCVRRHARRRRSTDIQRRPPAATTNQGMT